MAKGASGPTAQLPPELPVAHHGNGNLCDRDNDPVCYWNDQFLRAAFHDSRKDQVDQEQGGPIRVARVGAIVHAAIHDAVNGVEPVYEPYLVRQLAPVSSPGPDKTPPSVAAAIGGAAFTTLCWLYPSRVNELTGAFLGFFGGSPPTMDPGLAYGFAVGGAYILARSDDGSQRWDVINAGDPDAIRRRDPGENPAEAPYRMRDAAGEWRSDPLDYDPKDGLQKPVGPGWGSVRPFTFGGGSLFRPGPYTPPLASPSPFPGVTDYTTAFNEVRDKGDYRASTEATRNQAFFWSYDDELGTPIRNFNRVIWQVLTTNPAPVGGPVKQYHAHARLFALANIAMADAGVVTRDTKYAYNHWRPIEGVRRADEFNAIYGTSLVKKGDFTPVGRPRNKSRRPNTTPPFPAYTSGHSAFGRSMFDILGLVLGAPNPFTLSTEEGDVYDSSTPPVLRTGTPRAIPPRPFNTFDEAANDNGYSRILLGVHWKFDDDQGQNFARHIAAHVFGNFLRRLGGN